MGRATCIHLAMILGLLIGPACAAPDETADEPAAEDRPSGAIETGADLLARVESSGPVQTAVAMLNEVGCRVPLAIDPDSVLVPHPDHGLTGAYVQQRPCENAPDSLGKVTVALGRSAEVMAVSAQVVFGSGGEDFAAIIVDSEGNAVQFDSPLAYEKAWTDTAIAEYYAGTELSDPELGTRSLATVVAEELTNLQPALSDPYNLFTCGGCVAAVTTLRQVMVGIICAAIAEVPGWLVGFYVGAQCLAATGVTGGAASPFCGVVTVVTAGLVVVGAAVWCADITPEPIRVDRDLCALPGLCPSPSDCSIDEGPYYLQGAPSQPGDAHDCDGAAENCCLEVVSCQTAEDAVLTWGRADDPSCYTGYEDSLWVWHRDLVLSDGTTPAFPD